MLAYRVGVRGGGPAFELRLEGKVLEVHTLVWCSEPFDKYVVGNCIARGTWDFVAHRAAEVDENFSKPLVEIANRVFGAEMRKTDVPRQAGVFSPGCCVCGADRNTFPETAIFDEYGNLMETNGKPWIAPDEPIQWRCAVCERLVCRNCTLTRDDLGFGKQYYATTYCSPSCRTAAPSRFHQIDDVMC